MRLPETGFSLTWAFHAMRWLLSEDKMAKNLKTTTPNIKFNELEVAILSRDITENGMVYRAGTKGTIVHVHDNYKGYEVEVSELNNNVLTVLPLDITK